MSVEQTWYMEKARQQRARIPIRNGSLNGTERHPSKGQIDPSRSGYNSPVVQEALGALEEDVRKTIYILVESSVEPFLYGEKTDLARILADRIRADAEMHLGGASCLISNALVSENMIRRVDPESNIVFFKEGYNGDLFAILNGNENGHASSNSGR